MTETVFVDTNVFVYSRDVTDRKKQTTAEKWLRELWIGQNGRTSIQVLSEYYAVVTRKLSAPLTHEEAVADMTALYAWEPVPADRAVLDRGLGIERRFGLSWWDSLIVAAAQIQGCGMLLTEDLQHGHVCDDLLIVNPFLNISAPGVAEAAEDYVPVPKPKPRHRGRGRPRKRGGL